MTSACLPSRPSEGREPACREAEGMLYQFRGQEQTDSVESGIGADRSGPGSLERIATVVRGALDAGGAVLSRFTEGRWVAVAACTRTGGPAGLSDPLAELVHRRKAEVLLDPGSGWELISAPPAPFGSYLGVPIPAAGDLEPLGVLGIFDRADRVWTEHDRALLGHLAQMAALELTYAQDLKERRSLEAQLRQSQRMEAVGRLAGGIAHDFNNMLTAISGHAQLLGLELAEESTLQEHIDVIRMAADRSAALTRQLLAFSRKQILQPQVVDLNGILEVIQPMLRRMIGEDIDVEIALDGELPAIFADPSQVEQVLMNLVINARDAMPRGGKLIVSTRHADLDEGYFEAHQVQGHPGRYGVLAVSDNGIGMDALVQSRIFEPFFTTKPVGKGTGLGLSTVYGIVKQTGGFVWVYSEPGLGTTFKIYLPLAHDSPSPEAAGSAQGEGPHGDATILVVEDDPLVRLLVCRVLRRAGYTVLEAENGGEAAGLVLSHQGPLDLLLTDIVLPTMSGKTIADLILERSPLTRVLYMSGYTDEAIVRHGVLERGMNFLEKPFTPERLLEGVRAVIQH